MMFLNKFWILLILFLASCAHTGKRDYITKPINIGNFMKTIDRALA